MGSCASMRGCSASQTSKETTEDSKDKPVRLSFGTITPIPGTGTAKLTITKPVRFVKVAKDKEDYIQRMAKLGWVVNWSEKRKHITYIDSAGHRVRDTKLVQSFAGYPDKESLERQLKHNREKTHKRTK